MFSKNNIGQRSQMYLPRDRTSRILQDLKTQAKAEKRELLRYIDSFLDKENVSKLDTNGVGVKNG